MQAVVRICHYWAGFRASPTVCNDSKKSSIEPVRHGTERMEDESLQSNMHLDEPSREALEFSLAQLRGVAFDTTLGASKRDAHHCQLPCHQTCKTAHITRCMTESVLPTLQMSVKIHEWPKSLTKVGCKPFGHRSAAAGIKVMHGRSKAATQWGDSFKDTTRN